MHLPNALWRRISPAKVTDDLLNPHHPEGGTKARYFAAFGFTGSDSELLMAALFDHPVRNAVERETVNPWGTKYAVRCTLQTPDNRNPCIYSIWIVDADGRPSFVTAYPA